MSTLRQPAGYTYDETFYDYIQVGSSSSASVIAPLLINSLNVASVLDVGCGAGAWLREYARHGVTKYSGVDGAYVQREQLLIPSSAFVGHDLTKPFDLNQGFDLVQCLEVAEHLPHSSGEMLVDTLVRHGDKVLFSAAVPGQGGENHINEQPLEYWRGLFANHGYFAFDFVRHAVKGNTHVAPWYRYNVLLYVRESAVGDLPASIISTAVAAGARIADVSPLHYRLRKMILRQCSPSFASFLAVQKHRFVLWSRSKAES